MKYLMTAVALLQICACAHKAAVKTGPEFSSPIIHVVTVDTLHLIPGPPAPNSARHQADYRILHQYQQNRTAAECARAQTEVKFDHFLDFFEEPRGPLTEKEIAPLRSFFDQLLTDARPIWTKGKDHWARKRPYLVDTSLTPCVPLEPNFAYPSGHAAAAQLYADVLTDLFPERKIQLAKRAQEIASDRVLGGVHHPSDIQDGAILGHAAYQALLVEPTYDDEFKQLKDSLE